MASMLTVGHGRLSADELAGLLTGAGVQRLVDIRSYPGSRRHPHMGRERMQAWLPGVSIAYAWLGELGGRRRPQPSSPHTGLRNEGFRAYADHMGSEEFSRGLGRLRGEATVGTVGVMCAESVWWRCHRRLLADHLVLIEGDHVEHLFHDGRHQVHPPTREAAVHGDHLVYEPD